MLHRHTSLSKNIIQFCRHLRYKGFVLGVEEETTALNALQYIDYNSKDIFRAAFIGLGFKGCSRFNAELVPLSGR